MKIGHNNLLERNHQIPSRWVKPKQRPKVTIAIGIICRKKGNPPHMVFASDSQTTYGAIKGMDAQKINIIDFADAQVLVAQAGYADLSARAIETMRKKAKEVHFETEETAVQIAVESVREIYEHQKKLNEGCITSDDGWRNFFGPLQIGFTLLVGYYYDRKPRLYTISLDQCLAIPVSLPYRAIGIGADVAEILLREYREVDPEFEYAQIIATATVEKTIDTVEGCGRPTWVGIVFPQEEAYLREAREQCLALEKGGVKPDSPIFESRAILIGTDATTWITDEFKKQDEINKNRRKEMLISTLKAAQAKHKEWVERDKKVARSRRLYQSLQEFEPKEQNQQK